MITDNEVIKALEICGNIVISSCKECSLHSIYNANCVKILMRNALDLLTRQKADLKQKDTEIDILIRKKETLKDEVSELRAEVERLKHILVSFMSEVETWDYKYGVDASNIPKIAILGTENESIIEQTKAEAYKEFAEKAPLIMVQFMMDELRIFIEDNCPDLDPVYAFNPTTEELKGYVQSARKYLGIDNLLTELTERKEDEE